MLSNYAMQTEVGHLLLEEMGGSTLRVYIKQAPDHTQATFMESLLCIFIIFIKQMVRQNKKFSSP